MKMLFKRKFNGDGLAYDEINDGCEWVAEGLGFATRKWDGTCCLVRGGELYRRYDAKNGKTPPVGFEPAQPEPDEHTRHWPGWLKVGDGPQDQFHREGWSNFLSRVGCVPVDGTYELCGPKIGKNPEGFEDNVLVRHGVEIYDDCPRDFEGLKAFLSSHGIEGIVWWQSKSQKCEKVKVRAADFGIKR